MRHLPPLAAVRVFEAAARHENFTQAAAELSMTQAAVSYQVKMLEERLGVALFIRHRRRVTLSEAGSRIAPLITDAFDRIDDAFGMARAAGSGSLTISCSSTFGTNWLAPRIGGFQIAHPEMAVRIEISETLVDFARDEVDVAIRTGLGRWPNLTARFLMRMPVAALASPDYLAARPPLQSIDDILRLDRISPDDSWWTMWREQLGATIPASVSRRGVRLDSQLMEGRAALAGQGFAILNTLLWRAELTAGRLVDPLGRVALDPASFWLVYPEGHRNAPKLRAFRDWLLAEVARDAADDSDGFFAMAD